MVVTYNGRDVFLFIYCSSCNQWRMPAEGGHTGSHHEEFLNGDVCLPVSHTAWQIYYKLNLFYGITVPIAPVHWNAPRPRANIHERVNMRPPRMIEFHQAVINNEPMEVDSNNNVEDQLPPPAAAPVNHHHVDENNADGLATGRPVRVNAGRIDRYVPSPKRQRKNPLQNRPGNRNRAQDDSSTDDVNVDSDFDNAS
jgi:hypothetical protein